MPKRREWYYMYTNQFIWDHYAKFCEVHICFLTVFHFMFKNNIASLKNLSKYSCSLIYCAKYIYIRDYDFSHLLFIRLKTVFEHFIILTNNKLLLPGAILFSATPHGRVMNWNKFSLLEKYKFCFNAKTLGYDETVTAVIISARSCTRKWIFH